jgi:hypothetical protein
VKPIPLRWFVNELKRRCKAKGLELLQEPRRGSHVALFFVDPADGSHITITIARHKEVSPGVQRGVLAYLGRLAAEVTVAEIVKEIVETLTSA